MISLHSTQNIHSLDFCWFFFLVILPLFDKNLATQRGKTEITTMTTADNNEIKLRKKKKKRTSVGKTQQQRQ